MPFQLLLPEISGVGAWTGEIRAHQGGQLHKCLAAESLDARIAERTHI